MSEQNSKETSVSTPRHWVGPEELSPSYWQDPVALEKRGQEFFEKPIEQIDQIDKTDQKGFARRDFLAVMGASMAMMTMACARRPVRKIIPYVNKPEGLLPGVPVFYASTLLGSAEGVLVKNREGRPIKHDGNPDHPLSQGALSARAQASLLSLYDPERLQAPVARSRSTGGTIATTWEQVDAGVVEKLKSIRTSGGKVVVLTGRNTSPTSKRAIREFLSGFAKGAAIEFEMISDEAQAQAQLSAYGSAVVPFYRFDEAKVVLSFGADFLGTDPLSTVYQKAFSKQRKVEKKRGGMNQLHVFEAMMTVTGTNADFRTPVRAGDEVFAALAVAHTLIVAQKHTRFASDSAVVSALQPFSAKKVAEVLGVTPDVFTSAADALFKAQGKGIVLGGSPLSAHAYELNIIASLLNAALGNEGSTVDGNRFARAVDGGSNGLSAVQGLISEMNSGQVAALIVAGANPCYSVPKSFGFEEALKKVPYVVSFSEGATETSRCADLELPAHHSLESWGDSEMVPGVVSIAQPALAPITTSRQFETALVVWGKKLGITNGLLGSASVNANEEGYHDYLRANWRESRFPRFGGGQTFDAFWEGALKKGVMGSIEGGASARSFRSASLASLPKKLDSAPGMRVALYEKISMGDGSSANNAWLQELPDPVTKVTWDNYANVSPNIAKKMNLGENDVLELDIGGVKLELPVHVQPGLRDDTVAVAVGYGRRVSGKVGQGAGVDVTPVIALEGSSVRGSGRAVSLRKTGRQYRLANTQWHHVTENRPIINDLSLEEWLKDPASENHTNPHLRLKEVPSMWKKHKYLGNRWGMTIDLTACTGCSACVIACQAENNIPVVGRDQVRNSRIMHWIRIDRYYSGDANNPDTVYQPMLCQHCENAPCETVCPVLATVHDDEGLNAMSYNRCVGTRYCQNNCPYKVRRFNFFDHWKSYTGTMNMVWNPEVTVRTRGIMEKCTFCVQRINDAKYAAKAEGRKLKDGELQTACQQTCPTDAIVFGNMNDPEAEVSKAKKLPRDFRVLEDLNVVPVVSYLSKVRNKPGYKAGGDHGKH